MPRTAHAVDIGDAPLMMEAPPSEVERGNPVGPVVESMVARDGIRLDADVYRPGEPGFYPVLLVRQAYGRRVASTLCYAHPSWYAAQGYIVVVQDVRGRGTSDGEFRTFGNEAADGADAVAWAAALAGSTGVVGMYGFSYQGMTQLYAAAEPTPALKALAPAMLGWDIREDWAYENGAFRLAGNLGWAMQLAADTARLTGQVEAFETFHQLCHGPLPLDLPNPSRPDVMMRWSGLSHYQAWLDAAADDAYWRRISPAATLDRLVAHRLPMLFIGGWFDSHLAGTLAAYRALADRSAAATHLAVGPWTHFPWDRMVGELDFGPQAVSDLDRLQVRWFDHWLKGVDTGLLQEPSVRMFDMGRSEAGGARWRGFDRWPAGWLEFNLRGDGRAALDGCAGVLSLDPALAAGWEAVVHDPWRPAPSVGGAFGAPAGPFDRRAVDARSDVMTFTTAPMTKPLVLAGDVSANLIVTSDAESFDLACVLSRVDANGAVFQLAEGYGTWRAHDVEAIVLSLKATCATIGAGEALRLSVGLASYPAYPVNPGTGAAPWNADLFDAQVITVRLLTGPAGSRLQVSSPDVGAMA